MPDSDVREQTGGTTKVQQRRISVEEGKQLLMI